MQPLTWTRNPETATMIGAHQVYETTKTPKHGAAFPPTRVRIIKFGESDLSETHYPYTIAVNAGSLTDGEFWNVVAPCLMGEQILHHISVRDAHGFVQGFTDIMREVDHSYPTLKEAKEAVESMKFLFSHRAEDRPDGWPYAAGSFIPEPRRY